MAQRRKRRKLESGSQYMAEARKIKNAFTRIYNYKTERNLVKAYKKYAKMADQRLVRLEKAAQTKGYENILQYAYKRAVQDIKAWDILGRKSTGKKPITYEKQRFNRNIPKTKSGKVDIAALKSKLTDIERFLVSVTSTKAGVTEMYEKRAKELNKNAGLRGAARVTWEDMQNFYGSETADIMKEQGYGSWTIVRAIGAIKRHKEGITAAVVKDATKNIKVSNDLNVNLVANALLENGFDPENMFKP